ncbi:MAG: T9SS type A sorting domain-containing protein [Ferruginibacter sp.]
MERIFIVLLSIFSYLSAFTQTNIVTYAGNTGKETFYDVTQITDGTILVVGYAENLGWVGTAPKTELTYTASIPNTLGTNRYGFILHLSADLQTILHVVHFPQGAVEDIRFIKTNTQPYTPTGDLYISCNTSDTDPNKGGYIIAKLDHNFINGIPSSLSWVNVVWAKSIAKEAHPWDVTSDGKVYFLGGEAYGYDWSAVYCLNQNGQQAVVNNWRTHWLKNGTEWKGTPASANPFGGIDSVGYSGIVLKIWGRCDLRSWTASDYNNDFPDGNGGIKKGKWPLDILFSGPCDPTNPTAAGPGYTGYSASGTPVYGGSSICIDRRNNDVYIGMNFKSVLPGGLPDFEPAVIAMDSTGSLKWWSRLYHEITPTGDTVNSSPDQYVDALAIDYNHNTLVVGARCHGNNVENLWEGNTINSNLAAAGFQNQFTGSSGNIHISWLGKLQLNNGVLSNATYMAEYAEGTGALGAPHPDTNLDGWPNPNDGWPDVNSTRMAKNNLKVTSNGDVCILAVGRRTITTANAYQKMVKPGSGGLSAWNSFVRMYDPQLSVPKYSSLLVGAWDTLTQAGGGNTDLYGLYKTSKGIIAVGRHSANASGVPNGNNIPVVNTVTWGTSIPQNESAILVYYQASNLVDNNDSITVVPLTMGPLRVQYREGKSNLSWQTFTETNVNRFEIERSTDASIFKNIGVVNAVGNTNNTAGYYFQDAKPTTGFNYYRLRILDEDGRFYYSNVVNVNAAINNVAIFQISPNPFKDKIQVSTNSAVATQIMLAVYDNTGRLVKTKTGNIQQGPSVFILNDLADLQQGIYYLKIVTDGSVFNGKLIK